MPQPSGPKSSGSGGNGGEGRGADDGNCGFMSLADQPPSQGCSLYDALWCKAAHALFRLRLHTEDCGLSELKFTIQLAKPVDHTMFQHAKITSIIGQESETSLAIDDDFDFN